MLSREGMPFALFTGLGAAAVAHTAGWMFSMPVWAAFVSIVYVFYERKCEAPSRPNGVIAPADGVVTRISEVRDNWLEREVSRVRVKLRFPGVTVTRSPVSGKVVEYLTGLDPFDGPEGREQGNGNPANRDDVSPNAYALHVRTDEGDDVITVVSSLLPLSRVKLDVSPGGRVGQSHRYGFVYFSDYIDVLVAKGSHTAVEVGQRVRSGETLIATLHRAPTSA
ncbi:MAG: phosphatidylserine decarboxylase [Gammaproteobacteria bacterium]